MSLFDSWFSILLAAAVTGAVADLFLKGFLTDKNAGLRRGVQFVAGLVVVAAVFLPLLRTIGQFPSEEFLVPDQAAQESGLNLSIQDNYLIAMTKKESEQKLQDMIFQKFGINPLSVIIEFDCTESDDAIEVVIREAVIAIKEEDAAKGQLISEFAERLLDCEVTVHSGEET